MPFEQEPCHVEHRGADGNTGSKRAATSNPCCACPKVRLISVNSHQPLLSLEYHRKHTHFLEVNTFMEPFKYVTFYGL